MIEPVFEEIADGFRVVLNNEKLNAQEKVTDKVTDNQQKILEQIEQDSYITTRKMAEAVGISQRKIKGNIQILKEKGLLERIGPAKGGYWKINKEI